MRWIALAVGVFTLAIFGAVIYIQIEIDQTNAETSKILGETSKIRADTRQIIRETHVIQERTALKLKCLDRMLKRMNGRLAEIPSDYPTEAECNAITARPDAPTELDVDTRPRRTIP